MNPHEVRELANPNLIRRKLRETKTVNLIQIQPRGRSYDTVISRQGESTSDALKLQRQADKHNQTRGQLVDGAMTIGDEETEKRVE